ncbi:DNA helicase-2 / ATP-dependent DNA helicase PcrA [Bhargavaea ginsengi]|uniref:DNA helicase-2 / ATP-dependent DNA helicase PcrA n=1 Tax=Bhargavaea ginsengi TaxID=426757 RepID=A0A1H6X0E6_9BACL|nr:RNA polymerase recycling motor HelD [Bhargavaea ginsengi]SEJ18530.1 DNA helicase-2 / ATP-dependent DNA helicase PcrA [Bhargavaea ginsengi]
MNRELRYEQDRVNLVMGTISKEIGKLETETARRKGEVIQIRRHFWDEVKVNTDTFDDYLETIIGLRQEAQALSVSEGSHRHASQRLKVLQRMKESPYFGRIDFTESGESAPESFYIGISSLTDEDGEDFLVYDWRAPVSSVYYDCQPGPAEYSTPGGAVHGQLDGKWQYLIRDGVLQSMFDTSLTIGDEILQEVLGKQSDKQMHSIVATIQQDQNRIIRHDHGRLLIVHGAAGSGKTSAALQRIAYLLYKYRDQLNADQIILFSPNTMFSSYVSNVLPELGEENMQQVTFQDYLEHRLGDEFDVETSYGQLESVLSMGDADAKSLRVQSIRFKSAVRFIEVIKSYSESLESSGMRFRDVTFRGRPIITAEQMAERFYSLDPALRVHNRLDKLKEWLLGELKNLQKAEWKKPWVQDEIELLSEDAYHKAHRYLAGKRGYTKEAVADYEMEPEALARLVVHQKMKPHRRKIREYQFVDYKAMYGQLFEEPSQIGRWTNGETPVEWGAICRMTTDVLKAGRLFHEDATPYLFLKELILGFQSNSSIRHVVIDEAQDYSPFQFEFLKRLFPSAKMTVLGDFNQAIYSHADGRTDFSALSGLYGPDQTEVVNLTRSYRSTRPIIEFTKKLIPHGENIIPFDRDGVWPSLEQVGDFEDLHSRIILKIHELRRQGHQSIAVICQSAAESLNAYRSLSGIDGLKLIKSGTGEYEQGTVVIPSYLSKGIEFDAVIIYNASRDVYGDESVRRLFYTACTRAMHILHLYSVGKTSPFLEEALQEGALQV